MAAAELTQSAPDCHDDPSRNVNALKPFILPLFSERFSGRTKNAHSFL